MKAIATQIGNSKKESIAIDGEIFLKSVGIGRWNYIVELQYEGRTVYGKSATRENAAKWVPFPMNHEITLSVNGKKNDQYTTADIEEFKANHSGAEVVRTRPSRICGVRATVLRAPINYTRKIVKIERGDKPAPAPVENKQPAPNHATREAWLNDLAQRLNDTLFADQPLTNFRVTCGWPSKGAVSTKNRTIGQCFNPTCSGDKTTELIVSMALDDTMKIAGVLAHEMIHGIVGTECGHKGPFRKLAIAIGLTGKMTATTEGPAFIEAVQPILDALGTYPHAKLDYSSLPKQSTRLIKAECECGYNVRITRKWLNEVGAPHCPLHGEMEVC